MRNIFLLFLLAVLDTSLGDRILFLPFPWKSHVFEFTAIGDELHSRGHEISIVLPPTYPEFNKLKADDRFELIDYIVADKDMYGMEEEQKDDMIQFLMDITPIQDFRQNIDGFSQFCTNPLSDEELFKKLKSKKFDLAIVDALPCSRCLYVFPYRLGIPHVSLSAQYEPWLMRTPALPSFVPFPLAQYYTEKMTFMERLSNLFTLLDWSISTRIPYIADDAMRKYIPDKPFRSMDTLARDTKLWLFDTDIILDYPRPTMPNEINIGGLSTKPAKELPEALLRFVDDAKDGFIVVSFGSFDVLTEGILKILLNGFSKLSQKTILRTTKSEKDLGSQIPTNVRIMKWIPQNDLLAHPNCRLFITHCGANGQFEALYHAVPMLGFPVFGDQPYNARRMEHHGFGLHLSFQTVDSDILVHTIERILNNMTFYEKIDRASKIFRNRIMTPRERAAFWVEEVLDHDVDYLRSHGLDMPWYEYLMLDIFLVLVTGFFIALLLIYCMLRQIIQACSSNKKKEKIQ